ncbi:MAG: hypothetical protein IVW55_04715 [Chloroflexi bacterium]|nr:hypothetical protein [Chloroflexota bacterium]
MIDPDELRRWVEAKVAESAKADQAAEMIDPDAIRRRIEEKITANLSEVIGTRLHNVYYRRFPFELGPEGTAERTKPFFYTDGEVELRFALGRSIFITWCSAPRPNREDAAYMVCALDASGFTMDAELTSFEVSEARAWKLLVDSTLQRVDLLGWDVLPYVLKLQFEGGSVYIGSGDGSYRAGVTYGFFGDGDCVLVCTPEELQAQQRLSLSEGTEWKVLLSLPEVEGRGGPSA